MAEKKPAAVIAAEIALEAKKAEVAATDEALKRLRTELGEAIAAVRAAQTAADASLPQCQMAVRSGFSGRQESEERVVILKQTPGGTLVARPVGETAGVEYRFQLGRYSGRWDQIGKSGLFNSRRELRDVPAEFMPKDTP